MRDSLEQRKPQLRKHSAIRDFHPTISYYASAEVDPLLAELAQLRARVAILDAQEVKLPELKPYRGWLSDATLAEKLRYAEIAEAAYVKSGLNPEAELWGEDVSLLRELTALRKALSDPTTVHVNILRGTIALTKGQAIHIAGLPADIEEEFTALRANHKRLVEALESVQPYMEAAEKAGLVGDEGCHWPVANVRAVLAEARKLEGK